MHIVYLVYIVYIYIYRRALYEPSCARRVPLFRLPKITQTPFCFPLCVFVSFFGLPWLLGVGVNVGCGALLLLIWSICLSPSFPLSLSHFLSLTYVNEMKSAFAIENGPKTNISTICSSPGLLSMAYKIFSI